MRVGVLMVGDSVDGGGGAERRFARLCAYTGWSVAEPVLLAPSPLVASLARAGIAVPPARTVLLDHNAGEWQSLSGRVIEVVRERRFDVLHLVLLQSELLPLYFRLALPRRFAVSHTVALSRYGAARNGLKALDLGAELVWGLADGIEALYPGFARTWGRRQMLRRKTWIAPGSFTDPSRFVPSESKRPRIVFLGRLVEEKRPLLFVEAMSRLARSGIVGWDAVVCGDGPLRNQVRAAVTAYGLDSQVSVTAAPDAAKVLSESTIFLSCQATENYPSQSMLEAMASGNAVVACDVGDTARLVHHRETGLLVEPSPDGFARACELLLREPSLALEMGVRGRALVLREHTIEVYAAHLERVWNACLNRRR